MNAVRTFKGVLIALFVVFAVWFTRNWNDADLSQMIYQALFPTPLGLAGLQYIDEKRLNRAVKQAVSVSVPICVLSLAFVSQKITVFAVQFSFGFALASVAVGCVFIVFFGVVTGKPRSQEKQMPSESGLSYRKKALSEPLQGISSALASGHRGLLDAYKVFESGIKDRNLMGVLRIESELLSQLFIEMESIVKPIDDELRKHDEYMQGRMFRSKKSEDMQKEITIGKLDQLGRAFSLRREILQEIAKVLEKYGAG